MEQMKGQVNLTITIRDDDTMAETVTKVSLFQLTNPQASARIGSAVLKVIREMGIGDFDERQKVGPRSAENGSDREERQP